MSTLRVNRIEPRTGDSVEIVGLEAPAASVKAWASLNNNPLTVKESYGFSSIVDAGVGHLICNFSAGLMPDANYAVVGCSNEQDGFTRVFHATVLQQDNFIAFIKGVSNDNLDTDVVGIMVAR